MSKKNQPQIVTVFLTIALMIASGLIGHLWTRITYLDQEKTTPTVAQVDQQENGGAQLPTQPNQVDPLNDTDLVLGDKDAPINLFIYTDFECPYCSKVHPTVISLIEKNQDQLNLIYRHLPLNSIHPKAETFAQAVECARKYGSDQAAWDLIEEIFADQTVAIDEIANLVTPLGLSSSSIQNCIDSEETMDIVQWGLNSASAAGITGTPGGILYNNQTGDSRLVPGAVPEAQFQSLLDEISN
jgi:protein-disulfide isomerase